MNYMDVINSHIKMNDGMFKVTNRYLFVKNLSTFNTVYLCVLSKFRNNNTVDLDMQCDILYRSLIQRMKIKEIKRLEVTSRILKEL